MAGYRLGVENTGRPELEADPSGRGESHAKVILFGEHAALYGSSAIVWPLTAITARSEIFRSAGSGVSVAADVSGSGQLVEQDPSSPLVIAADAVLALLGRHSTPLRVRVRNAIPVARGLGASAAMAASVVDGIAAACGVGLSDQDRFDAIQLAETEAHGRSSGIDIRGITASTPIIVAGGAATPFLPDSRCTLIVADSGTPSHTVRAVSVVARAVATPEGAAQMAKLKAVCSAAVDATRASWDPVAIGALMREAHTALRALGVSSPEIERLVCTALGVPGVLGVKVTGGGMGGAVVAMSTAGAAPAATRALTEAGARQCWTTSVQGGVLV